MKKYLSLVLALAMTLSLAACGSSSESSTSSGSSSGSSSSASSGSSASTSGTQKLTLILRAGAYAETIKLALPAFEEANDVECEVLELDFDDLHTKIALDSPNAVGQYDLCMVDGSWMSEFANAGVLANLSDLGYELDDDIIPATTAICRMDGDVYLAPYYGNVTVMMYNYELIEAAGYSPEELTTFDALMDIAQQTNAAGKNGFVIRGGSGDNIVTDFLPHLLAHNGWVLDDNGQPTVNTPEFKAAFENYLDLYALGTTMDKDDMVAAVDGGTAALGQVWPGWYVPQDGGNANYTVIPTMLDDSDAAKNTAIYGVWTIGLTANGQNQDLTLQLLEYLMSPEVQLDSVLSGGVPCRYSSLLDEDVLAVYPHLETVCAALETGVYRPIIEEWAEFTNILGTEMDTVIQGVKTMDAALDEAQMQLEMLLA